MIEGKTLYAMLTIIGVPAFIIAWFDTTLLNIASGWDLAKTITLAVIAIGLGLFALIRSLIKTIYELWEFKDKYKTRVKEKKRGC